jgi:AcrR family transcriptional regulator
MTDVPAGLRERKKQRRRATIAAAALELFDRQGFAATTIPQIAEAADVAPRTVSSYFPAKEDLLFPDAADERERLERRLRERAPGERAAEALRAWIVDELPAWRAQEAQALARRRVIAADPALQAVEQELISSMERVFAAAIADDLGLAGESLEARMAAAATLAVFDVLGADHKEAHECAPETMDWDAMLLQLDRALAFVDAGIQALRED